MLTVVTLVVVGCDNRGDDKPIVETSLVREITGSTVYVGGVVTSNAGGEIVERGVCWGGQYNPAVSGSHVVVGTGLGTFTCEITGLTPNTTYHVRAYAINKGGIEYGDDQSFTTLSHDCVDLGLPSGTLWATCNIGADTPEGYGSYFAWGETVPKTIYGWNTYKYANGSANTITKYCNNSDYGYNGFIDDLITLQSIDDPATTWGDGWHMPSRVEWDELLLNTTNQWTTRNGINGRLFTSSNGNSIFLPASSFKLYLNGVNRDNTIGSEGCYWSSSLRIDYTYRAWSFVFNSDNYTMGSNYVNREQGRSVRPVCSLK